MSVGPLAKRREQKAYLWLKMTYIVVCCKEISFVLLPEEEDAKSLYQRSEVACDLLQHFGPLRNSIDELRARVNHLVRREGINQFPGKGWA